LFADVSIYSEEGPFTFSITAPLAAVVESSKIVSVLTWAQDDAKSVRVLIPFHLLNSKMHT
jgi:hypothetical protein